MGYLIMLKMKLVECIDTSLRWKSKRLNFNILKRTGGNYQLSDEQVVRANDLFIK